MKQIPKEHKFVAHCLAYLLGKFKDSRIVSVSVKNKTETLQILKRDLRKIYKKTECETKDILKRLEPVVDKPGKGGDIKALLWGGITLTVEAKGTKQENTARDIYAIYTVLGQLLCLFKKFARNQWYGLACPGAWKKGLYNKLKGSPIIEMVIKECRKRDQRMFFYFVNKNGTVESYQWSSFFKNPFKN
jgi:hypothetical protein